MLLEIFNDKKSDLYPCFNVLEHHEEPFNKAILDGFAVSVGIFMLSSLRNCIIYSLRNREYRSSSKSLWKNIKNKICRYTL